MNSAVTCNLFPETYRGAEGLAEDVRYYGQWMRDEAEKRIGHLYPKVKITKAMAKDRPDLAESVGHDLTVVAWLWARTVVSSNPAYADAHVPLVKSFWLSKKKGKEAWVRPIIHYKKKDYTFQVQTGKPPADELELVENGTKLSRGCSFRCLFSESPIPEEHVKAEGTANRMASRLMAVVCNIGSKRVYLTPTPEMAATACVEPPEADGINAPIAEDKRALWCLLYGLTHFHKLFTPRQLTALITFSDLVSEVRSHVLEDAKVINPSFEKDLPLRAGGNGARAYADAITTYLSFSLSKAADYWSNLCSWHSSKEFIRNTFGRQALPMVWDFAEVNPFQGGTGGFGSVWTERMLKCLPTASDGEARQLDAKAVFDRTGKPVISTDPPYYDNIGYADLSDFFYVWLRRNLRNVYPELLSTMLTPKSDELIASQYRHSGSKAKAAVFFETGLGQAIEQWRNQGNGDYPTTIFYAFKQSETDNEGTASTGWETFLAGVIANGFSITATWPMRTEMGNRMVGSGTNALASSIALACLPRAVDALMATRKEFADALRAELPPSIRTMQSGNVAPVDLAQASIGPGMAVFSRYSKVVNADGSPMRVREALQLINQVLDEALTEQESDFDAETRWALKWHEQYGQKEGPFGDAETLAKAMAVSVKGIVEAGIANGRAGKVRLLKRAELGDQGAGRGHQGADYDPTTDKRVCVWEITQHLILALETSGEQGAARLLKRVGGGWGETARELAYRLYQTCERKKWADEARSYNGLVVSWPEIEKIARERPIPAETQSELF